MYDFQSFNLIPFLLFPEALSHKDGEDIILDIYDNVQEELRVKNKLLQTEKDKVHVRLKCGYHNAPQGNPTCIVKPLFPNHWIGA